MSRPGRDTRRIAGGKGANAESEHCEESSSVNELESSRELLESDSVR